MARKAVGGRDREAVSLHRNFVSVVRENTAEYGDQRSVTFVQEKGRNGRAPATVGLSLSELDRKARAVAELLRSRKMRDRPVLLLYPQGIEFLAAFLGCLYSRALAIPAPLPELNSRSMDRTSGIIADAGVSLVLTDTAHQPRLREWTSRSGETWRPECVATDAESAEGDPEEWVMPDLGEDTPAFLQYTSGSTSMPKGVVISHGNLLHNSADIKHLVSGDSEALGIGWIPHYHDMGLIGQLLQPLYLGCDSVFMAPVTFLRSPALWWESISRYRATHTVAPNFGYELSLRRVAAEQLEGLDLSCLRAVLNGAEPVRADTVARMVDRFGPAGFRPEAWVPCYGMAETTLLIAGSPPGTPATVEDFDLESLAEGAAVPEAGLKGKRLVSCGPPVSMDVRIVDPHTREVRTDGRIGEIWVQGGSVAKGYWRSPDRTAEVFRAFTDAGEGPYLRTGDLGFLRGGELYVTGRIKDLIIVNGQNLYATDIEDYARRIHPAAGTAAVFSLEEAPQEVILVQEVTKAALGDKDPDTFAADLRSAVARFFGLPSLSVVVTRRGAVRQTTSGKVQRTATRHALLRGELSWSAGRTTAEVARLCPPEASRSGREPESEESAVAKS